jgi:hypothetical protein
MIEPEMTPAERTAARRRGLRLALYLPLVGLQALGAMRLVGWVIPALPAWWPR